MKRVYGFLNINEYFEQIKKENNYTDDDLEHLGYYKPSDYSLGQYWLRIYDELYYFKTSAYLYEELVASECAKFLGIDSVTYDLAEFQYLEGVISKSYRKEGAEYTSGDSILLEYIENTENITVLENMGYDKEKLKDYPRRYKIADSINNLEIIWQALEYKYPGNLEDIEKVMDKLVLIFILNILLGQVDGMPQNWEIEETIDGIDLVPFFDGELTLQQIDPLAVCNCSLSVNFNDKNKTNYEILKEFFRVSSQEYIDLFIEKFNLLTLENFLLIIEALEKRIERKIPPKDKRDIIANFTENRKNIEVIVEEFYNSRKGVR